MIRALNGRTDPVPETSPERGGSGSGIGLPSDLPSFDAFGVGGGIGIGIGSQRCSIPIPIATSTPRGFYAPFQGAGIIWDLDPGWASFLGQPGAIGCNASGVGNMADGEAGSFAVDVRGGGLVLEPMGSWDGVECWAWWFEYEYRPSG